MAPELGVARRVRLDVGDVLHGPREHRKLGGKGWWVGQAEPLSGGVGASRRPAPRRHQADQRAVVPEHGGGPRPEEPHGAVHDCLEDRLRVRLRLADGPEDLGGRRLSVQRLREVAVARLQFPEEAHVLDGDHGLVGKGLKQRDLLVGERTDLGPEKEYRADGCALSKQGYGEGGALSGGEPAGQGELVRLALQVGNVDDPAFDDRAAIHRPA